MKRILYFTLIGLVVYIFTVRLFPAKPPKAKNSIIASPLFVIVCSVPGGIYKISRLQNLWCHHRV
jgi:hypothetical protein